MIPIIITCAWATGWLFSLALAAAYLFAKYGTIAPTGVPGWSEDDSAMTPVLGPMLMIVLWPVFIAFAIGWFLKPYVQKMIAHRA